MFTISVNKCIVVVWTLLVVVNKDVRGLQISVKPPSVINGVVSNVTMECSLSQNETRVHIKSLLFISIRHKRISQDTNSDKVVAILTASDKTPTAGQVIESRRPPVLITGSLWESPKPGARPNEARLTLQWPGESWECGDYGDYQCEMKCLDSSYRPTDYRSPTVRLPSNSSEDACNSSWPRPQGNYMVIVLVLTIVQIAVCLFCV